MTNNDYTDKENEEVIHSPVGDTTIHYNNDDLISQVDTPKGDTFQYQYDPDHNIKKVIGPGVTTDLTFNGEKVATLKATTGSGATVLDYAYDETEQLIQITDKGAVKKKYTYTPNGYLETVEAFGKYSRSVFMLLEVESVKELITVGAIGQKAIFDQMVVRVKHLANDSNNGDVRVFWQLQFLTFLCGCKISDQAFLAGSGRKPQILK